MESVFLLWHVYEKDGDEKELLIGAYPSGQEAKAAVERLKGKPGFVDYPDGFQTCPYELNRHSWEDGFKYTTD